MCLHTYNKMSAKQVRVHEFNDLFRIIIDFKSFASQMDQMRRKNIFSSDIIFIKSAE